MGFTSASGHASSIDTDLLGFSGSLTIDGETGSATVFIDIADRDIGSYVAEAQQVIAEKIELPAGYAVEFSGQFEQMQEANERLQIAIPAAVALIFLLLMLHFGRLDRTLIIMASLPFGLIGGMWAVWLAGYNLSVAVAVGFHFVGEILGHRRATDNHWNIQAFALNFFDNQLHERHGRG